jgi:hypothetical protein
MCKSRKTPALCLTLLSTLVFVCGILIIVMTVGMDSIESALDHPDMAIPEIKAAQTAGSAVLWICAILSLFVACAGCAAVKITHRAYIMCYGLLLGFIWLGVFITGCVFSGTAAAVPVILEGVCNQGVVSPTNAYEGKAIDRSIQILVNGQMCTPQCPCPPAAKANYDAVPEAKMNFFNRTRAAGTGNNTAQQIRMTYSGSKSYSNFTSCFKDVIAPNLGPKETKAINGYIKLMTGLERRFSCSGVCQPGLFYFSLDVTTDLATDNCLQYVANEIGNKYIPVGLVSIISGIIMGLIWLFQYVLWCKFDE